MLDQLPLAVLVQTMSAARPDPPSSKLASKTTSPPMVRRDRWQTLAAKKMRKLFKDDLV